MKRENRSPGKKACEVSVLSHLVYWLLCHWGAGGQKGNPGCFCELSSIGEITK